MEKTIVICALENKIRLVSNGKYYSIESKNESGEWDVVGRYPTVLNAVCGYVNYSLFEFGKMNPTGNINGLVDEIKKLNANINGSFGFENSVNDPVEKEIYNLEGAQ